MSYLQSDAELAQLSQKDLLERDADWALVIGLGYDANQKKGLIYRHLNKLLESLWVITHGDASKAKSLSDMLFLRMHAGASFLMDLQNVDRVRISLCSNIHFWHHALR